MTAQARYEALSSDRNQFLQSAIDASKLTLPYIIKQDEDNSSHKTLLNPYQSVGAKGVVTLASKLMLALLPVQTSFFKLQVDETSLIGEGIDPKVRSDLDLSFSKVLSFQPSALSFKTYLLQLSKCSSNKYSNCSLFPLLF